MKMCQKATGEYRKAKRADKAAANSETKIFTEDKMRSKGMLSNPFLHLCIWQMLTLHSRYALYQIMHSL